jgi:hypothetical protein
MTTDQQTLLRKAEENIGAAGVSDFLFEHSKS